jgi:hypothetical protein
MGDTTVSAERSHLEPREWATVYIGTTTKTVEVRFQGRIHKNAKLKIESDGAILAEITEDNDKTNVAGQKIRVYNAGSKNQGFDFRFI